VTVPVRVRRGPMAADNFTMISNGLIRDTRLSAQARMLAIWLLSHRVDYQVDTDAMGAAMGCGRDRTRTSLRELEAAGYLRRVSQRDGGQLVGIDYAITDNPQVAAIDGFSGDGADLTKPDSQARVSRPWESVAPYKKTKFQEDQEPEDQEKTSSPAGDGALFGVQAPSAALTRAAAEARLNAEFETAFWPEYPRRIGKQAALVAYRRARRNGVTVQDLTQGLRRFVQEKASTEARFIPHPSTWLNAGRWADEPEATTPTRNGHQPYQDNPDDWSYDDANPFPAGLPGAHWE
jgi:hypothetical protein